MKFKLTSRSGPPIDETYQATRPNKRSARVQISLQYQQLQGNKIGLVAKSKDAASCSEPCLDRAPNQGRWVVDY